MIGRNRGGGGFIIFLLYLVFGLYLMTSSLNLVTFPEFISKIDKWIIFIGGILIIIGGINHLRARNKFQYMRQPLMR